MGPFSQIRGFKNTGGKSVFALITGLFVQR